MSTRVIISLLVAISACSGFSVASPPSDPVAPAISVLTPTTTTSTTTTTPTTTTPAEVGPPLGLITPSGVPVAIESIIVDGYVVYTPCGRMTEITSGQPLYETTVVIDPGHGGRVDTGAVGRNGLTEKEVNLRVAYQVQETLAERGIDSVLTRTADYASTLNTRARLADTLGAELLVSIHHNAPTPGPSPVPGIEVFVQSDSADSRRLGGLLWQHTMAALSVFDVAWTAAPDAGVMTVVNTRGNDAYGMIRNPETPTALIELGYLSNPEEAELFATAEYVSVASRALADAIEAYLSSDAPGAGFGQGRVFNPNRGLGQDLCIDPRLEDVGSAG